MKKRVVIVGAGAAGLLAAGFAAQRGASVLVIEKTKRSAQKVRISGKGRCNITNGIPISDFPSHYPGNGRFLYGALHRFSNRDCMDFFAGLGVELKIERGQRVFPCSDDADQVANSLERFARQCGAELLFEHRVVELKCNSEGTIAGVITESSRGKTRFEADAVIMAAGGMSYPGTGSSGDGYRLAQMIGHTIVKPRPALVPLRTKESWVKEAAGLSLRNVTITFTNGSERISEFGEMMFTHFGITGPTVLTASEQVGVWLENGSCEVKASIDLKPALDDEQLDKRLIRDLQKYSRKQFSNSLNDLYPRSLIPIIVQLSGIPADKPTNQLTRNERLILGRLTKNLPLTIIGTLPLTAAIVTAGGVELTEVDPKTMESKLIKGLFFAGEVLNIHGVTGGFNLQAAFSTGYCAAQSV